MGPAARAREVGPTALGSGARDGAERAAKGWAFQSKSGISISETLPVRFNNTQLKDIFYRINQNNKTFNEEVVYDDNGDIIEFDDI